MIRVPQLQRAKQFLWQFCGWQLGSSRQIGESKILQGFDAVCSVIYPPVCAGCGLDLEQDKLLWPEVLLCQACCDALATEAAAVRRCSRCAYTVADVPEPVCSECLRNKFKFDSAFALGSYQGLLRKGILFCKDFRQERLAYTLGQLLACQGMPWLEQTAYDAVVPVPMHWLKRVRRRTNEAENLARGIAQVTRLRLDSSLLVRQRWAPSQQGSGRQRRSRNVQGAFRVVSGYNLKDARLLLVDDVMTTGATANQCTKVLKAAGAAQVDVLVLARASLQK